MNFTELSEITPGKVEELKGRIARLKIDLRLIEEQFVKGGGKGGQKINKTANAVLLKLVRPEPLPEMALAPVLRVFASVTAPLSLLVSAPDGKTP